MKTPPHPGGRPDVAESSPAQDRPALTPAMIERLRTYGSDETVSAGELLYQPGDDSYDLVWLESATVDLFCATASERDPVYLDPMGPGDFLGEISLYTGERMFITARVREPGTICRISTERFRQLMSRDAELSDVILTALYRRRGQLKTALADAIEIVDSSAHRRRCRW